MALGLLAWLAVRGGISTFTLVKELASEPGNWALAFRLTPEQRVTRALWGWDLDLGRKPGTSFALFKALETHVPPQATVWITGLGSLKQAQALLPMPHVSFPRRFEVARPRSGSEPSSAQDYWLFFESEAEAGQHAGLTRLAAGPDWSLWH